MIRHALQQPLEVVFAGDRAIDFKQPREPVLSNPLRCRAPRRRSERHGPEHGPRSPKLTNEALTQGAARRIIPINLTQIERKRGTHRLEHGQSCLAIALGALGVSEPFLRRGSRPESTPLSVVLARSTGNHEGLLEPDSSLFVKPCEVRDEGTRESEGRTMCLGLR